MYKLLSLLLCLVCRGIATTSLSASPLSALPLPADTLASSTSLQMRDVFATLPDSILPTVTRNNRLDCIDFIENNMEAKVRGSFGEYVTLEALTPTYLRFATSTSAYIEMKLLPAADSLIICFVSTVVTGADSLQLKDSSVRFYTTGWQPLPASNFLAIPSVPAFCTGTVSSQSLVPLAKSAQRSLLDFHPIHATPSPDSPALTLTLQIAELSIAERQAARELVRPITKTWTDGKWK
jgi:hypothetical protein